MGKTLTGSQVAFFRDNGFLVISGFFADAELDAAAEAYERVWRELPEDITVDVEATQRRVSVRDTTEAERATSIKVNDLFLRDGALREAVMSARMNAILSELLQDDPVVCNSLSVECGTQQADHLDTLFMTPETPGKLIATWMAIEDVDEQAGPLRYFPESNHIEPYVFVDGRYHVRDAEMDGWRDYMAGEVERHGLAETRFIAAKGDLLIWDAWLLHGGSEIVDPSLTRRSLITHYYSRPDAEKLPYPIEAMPGGGHWMNRKPFSAGSYEPPAPDAEPAAAATTAREPGLATPIAPADLRTRLDRLETEHH